MPPCSTCGAHVYDHSIGRKGGDGKGKGPVGVTPPQGETQQGPLKADGCAQSFSNASVVSLAGQSVSLARCPPPSPALSAPFIEG